MGVVWTNCLNIAVYWSVCLYFLFSQSSACTWGGYLLQQSYSVVKVLMSFIRLILRGTKWVCGSKAMHRVTCNVVHNVLCSKNNKINNNPGGNMTLVGKRGAGVQHLVHFFRTLSCYWGD